MTSNPFATPTAFASIASLRSTVWLRALFVCFGSTILFGEQHTIIPLRWGKLLVTMAFGCILGDLCMCRCLRAYVRTVATVPRRNAITIESCTNLLENMMTIGGASITIPHLSMGYSGQGIFGSRSLAAEVPELAKGC